MIAVTGANGKLGRQVIKKLLSFYPAEKLSDLPVILKTRQIFLR